ncbi:MAG: hypothetical protein V7L23_05780 [Nostoc sp.]|uniref:hypothetical protein n=1 Tax=Nostoc sp. TaxID=1180 RepID=UPI002FF03847
MTIPESIKQFIISIQGFDDPALQNEDNVKEKFILSMFHYLCYPERLQDFLEQCYFEPSTTREGYRLVVVKPKVAIACNLPKAFGEGNCQIKFSSILFKYLKIHLNHQDILGQLMTGLHTQAHWGCRRFLKQLDKDTFQVNLGQTTIILSNLEVTELCLCVDEVCQEYKNLIIEFENALETWDFEFVNFSESRGFILFSVRQELWELMQQFANEFDYTKGKSEWHLFHRENTSIRVSRGIRDHTFIFPKLDSDLSLLPKNQINIIYELNDINLKSIEIDNFSLWQQDIGIRGTWTARYTKQWLLEKYIPKVINYYSETSQISEVELLAKITNYTSERALIKEIDNIRNLVPYLRDIQSWLHIYVENIAASLLQPYYQAYTNLVRNTDSSITGIDYIIGNLRRVEWKNTQEENYSNFTDWKNLTFKYAIDCLDKQVTRINNCEYENSLNADLITRIFIWILENGKISFSQAQLNAAKQTLLPLWEQSRFEMRHVYPNR